MKTGPRILVTALLVISLIGFTGAYRKLNGLERNTGYVALHHPEAFAKMHAGDGMMCLYIASGFLLLAAGFGLFHKKLV